MRRVAEKYEDTNCTYVKGEKGRVVYQIVKSSVCP